MAAAVRRAAAIIVAVSLVLAGCGAGKTASTRITSDTLTIYTSLPLRGDRAAEGRAVLRGEKLALNEAGGRVGNLQIGLIALDDTKTRTGRWDPNQVAENARQAVENPTTIAYIGDLDSGASAVSIPITNETAILQVSPLSDYTGLTQVADKGEPAKYYPSGRRTFARLVPAGAVEARVLARWVRAAGIGRVVLAYDGLQEGLGQGSELERALQAAGVNVADVVRVDPRGDPSDVISDARDIARAPAPALIYAGAATASAIALLRAVNNLDPGETLFVSSGVEGAELAAGLGSAGRQVRLSSPLLPLGRRPAAAAAAAGRYRDLFGAEAPPEALYGYEAMRTVLEAIRRAGSRGNDRAGVIASYFKTAPSESVLGAYRIDALGDISSAKFGGFRVRDGRLVFERLLDTPALAPD